MSHKDQFHSADQYLESVVRKDNFVYFVK